jgi:hypothetical protein
MEAGRSYRLSDGRSPGPLDRKIRGPAVGAVLILVSMAAPAFLLPRGARAGVADLPPPAGTAIGGRITGEVRLSGRVRVTEDLFVPPGATLVVAPGTILSFDKSESSKVDPEFLFGGTEVVVRGALRASGAEFRVPDRSGGIVVAGGDAVLSDVSVTGAEVGISVLDGGRVTAAGPVRVTDCRVGVALHPAVLSPWAGEGEVKLAKNAIAAVRFPGAPAVPRSFRPGESDEADLLSWGDEAVERTVGTSPPPGASPAPGALRLADTFIDRDRAISGDVIVEGVIRVAPGATLSLAPGTRIFFAFRDTDGDGIGESGIFLQGNLSAPGTEEKPIVFRALEGGGRGLWDAINFMASDRGENVLAHVVIEGAYRGLHLHFSRLGGRDIRISRCVRGVQFQESEVRLARLSVEESQSALRCRDSDVVLGAFRSRATASGANFLRSRVDLVAPDIADPGLYGLRFRESRADVTGGAVRGALVGASVQEGTARLTRFRSAAAGLAGFSALDGDVTMVGFVSEGGLLDALSATAGRVVLDGGSLSGFGRYAVKIGGPVSVTLRGTVVTGGAGTQGNPIYDGRVSPGLGIVKVE